MSFSSCGNNPSDPCRVFGHSRFNPQTTTYPEMYETSSTGWKCPHCKCPPHKTHAFPLQFVFWKPKWFTKWQINPRERVGLWCRAKKNLSMRVYWRGTPEIGLFCFSRHHLGIMFGHHDFTLSLSIYIYVYIYIIIYAYAHICSYMCDYVYIYIYVELLSNH